MGSNVVAFASSSSSARRSRVPAPPESDRAVLHQLVQDLQFLCYARPFAVLKLAQLARDCVDATSRKEVR